MAGWLKCCCVRILEQIAEILGIHSTFEQAVLTEIYIEALLVDEELADQVWEAWDKGEIDDQVAWLVWWLITLTSQQSDKSSTTLRL